jgi:3-deoxy-D-manno-octulosonic-acid transferase
MAIESKPRGRSSVGLQGLPWLLNGIYFLFLIALTPLLAWRMLVRGKYRTGWSEKLLGRVPLRQGQGPCIWLHAVSVGEVLQLEPVLAELRQRLPDVEFVISTTTPTGRQVASTKFPEHRICYFPLDFSWAVRKTIRRIRPTAIVLVELELWPNFILQARRREIPLALINGRVSDRSARGYMRIRPLICHLLGSFEVLAAQNRTYANRLLHLGAPPARVHVTGSIKFDRMLTKRANPKTDSLRQSFRIANSDIVFVAGSTQAPEEAYAIETYQTLRVRYPQLRLILVPRHKERFEEAARLVRERGLSLLRRTTTLTNPGEAANRETLPQGDPPVLLLDTLGELAACWGLADVAFVGGSLTNRGGQNMIEPAGFGAAILFGPNTQNFRDVVEILLAENAARVVHSPSELTSAVADLLAGPQAAQEQGARAQRIVLSQQGATARTADLLMKLSCFEQSHIKAA